MSDSHMTDSHAFLEEPPVCMWAREHRVEAEAHNELGPDEDSEERCTRDAEQVGQLPRQLDEARPFDNASAFWRMAEKDAEGLSTWWLPADWELWFRNRTHNELVAFVLDDAFTERAKDDHAPGWAAEFYDLVGLIRNFRCGDSDGLIALAKAIRWQPRNDPATKRRFAQWCTQCVPAEPCDPDPYVQIVMTALVLMRAPKDGTHTLRELTPQDVRLGSRWPKGHRCPLVPLRDLGLSGYVRWFRNEVTRIIKHEILPDMDAKSEAGMPLESGLSQTGQWVTSPVELEQARRWRDAERAFPEAVIHRSERHVLDRAHVTKTSKDLRTLAGRIKSAGVTPSPLQRRILNLANEDSSLRNYREVAARLGCERENVKNAILRLRKKL